MMMLHMTHSNLRRLKLRNIGHTFSRHHLQLNYLHLSSWPCQYCHHSFSKSLVASPFHKDLPATLRECSAQEGLGSCHVVSSSYDGIILNHTAELQLAKQLMTFIESRVTLTKKQL